MIEISALATSKSIREMVEGSVNDLFDKWGHLYEAEVNALTDLRREVYRDIKAQAPDPQETNLGLPRVRIEDFEEIDEHGNAKLADLVSKHLMSDSDGNFPLTRLNQWERKVIQAEIAKPTMVAWYRNPPRSSGDSLCIAYRNEFGNWRGMYPDFILFEELEGVLLPSIVDPHRTDLDDALVKLKALSEFAGRYGEQFHRIESLAEIGGTMRVLDLTRTTVQKDIRYHAGELEALYRKHGEPLAAVSGTTPKPNKLSVPRPALF